MEALALPDVVRMFLHGGSKEARIVGSVRMLPWSRRHFSSHSSNFEQLPDASALSAERPMERPPFFLSLPTPADPSVVGQRITSDPLQPNNPPGRSVRCTTLTGRPTDDGHGQVLQQDR